MTSGKSLGRRFGMKKLLQLLPTDDLGLTVTTHLYGRPKILGEPIDQDLDNWVITNAAAAHIVAHIEDYGTRNPSCLLRRPKRTLLSYSAVNIAAQLK